MSDSGINGQSSDFNHNRSSVTRQNSINNMSIWGFIKGFGKLIIGFLLLLQGLIGLFLLLMIIGLFSGFSGSMNASNDSASVTIEQGSAFLFNPKGIITETAPEQDNFGVVLQQTLGGTDPSQIALSDAIKTIRAAKKDDKIKAMVIDLDQVVISGTSKAYALIDEIEAFKEADKKVYSVGNFYGQTQYLIASHADEILLNKSGGLSIYGYGVYRNYYKSLLEKLKVTSHVFRVGTYKAAVEPQLRDDMSPEAKTANLEFVSSLWDRYINDVAESRGIDVATVHQFADQYNVIMQRYKGDNTGAAKDLGFVDQVMMPSKIRKYLIDIFGEGDKKRDFKYVSFSKYLRSLNTPTKADGGENKIAVVTVAGTIMPGETQVGSVAGSNSIVKYLKKARKDDSVKALVLRVDSPGGSAYASEVIHDAILEVKDAGKPVIVSMGSLAASGGYLVSAPADEIWAAPTTITGSIGIFAAFTTFENLASEIGVTTDGVGTTSQAAILGTGIGALPDTTAQALQLSTEHGYESFLKIVADGRGLERDYVDSVGQGRIWTGEKALELKLVDKLGNLEDAIASAATKANLNDYQVTRFEDRRTALEKFFSGAAASTVKATGLDQSLARHHNSGVGQVVKAFDEQAKFLSSFDDPNHLYMRCLACEGANQ